MHMNLRIFMKILGILTLIEGIAMSPSFVCALVYEEWHVASPFLIVGMLCVCIGYVIFTQVRTHQIQLKLHEGFLIACLSWIYCSLIGALPFIFSGIGYSVIGSVFESVAGFTTTGCSVFFPEKMPKALLLWRSTENWLGGMGILVLIMSVFPALGIAGQSIAAAETTGPSFEKLGGRFSDTGKVLYIIYTAFTVTEFILLALGPLNIFDALINTLSSISTAGLVVVPENSVAFQGSYTRGVIMVFTLLSSINYSLYFFLLKKRWGLFFKNYEVKAFFKIIAFATVSIGLSLKLSGYYTDIFKALRDSLFQVISFISTSGYFVTDYTKWPSFAVIVLFAMLFVGGCTMSTSGSLKVIRVAVLFKLIRRGLFKQIHPNSVKAVVLDGEAVSAHKVSAIVSHVLLYLVVFWGGCLLLGLNNLDMETTITSSLALFTNTGMALGQPGASGYFGMFNGFSQFILALLMIAGRLEIYALALLFTGEFWKKDKIKKHTF